MPSKKNSILSSHQFTLPCREGNQGPDLPKSLAAAAWHSQELTQWMAGLSLFSNIKLPYALHGGQRIQSFQDKILCVIILILQAPSQ